MTRRCTALWMLCGLAGLATDAGAADLPPPGPPVNDAASVAPQLHQFDIPEQSLVDALDRYAAVSGRAAVYRSALVAGRRSVAVHGRYTAETALRLLIAGSGLEVETVDTGSVEALVLRPARSAAAVLPAAPPADEAVSARAGYDGLVQSRIWQALCAHTGTAETGYRSLLRFRVDPAGRVRQARLLVSSGDPERDRALLQVVQAVRIGLPPPPDMAQPLTLLILPQGQPGGPACGIDGGG